MDTPTSNVYSRVAATATADDCRSQVQAALDELRTAGPVCLAAIHLDDVINLYIIKRASAGDEEDVLAWVRNYEQETGTKILP